MSPNSRQPTRCCMVDHLTRLCSKRMRSCEIGHPRDLAVRFRTITSSVEHLAFTVRLQRNTLDIGGLYDVPVHLPEFVRTRGARVDSWSYGNPVTLDLVQGVAPGVEFTAGIGIFMAGLKVLFGSGPKERAEAQQIRARIHGDTGFDPPPTTDLILRSRREIDIYDWEIDT